MGHARTGVPLPNREERAEMVAHCLEGIDVDVDSLGTADIYALADHTRGWSPSRKNFPYTAASSHRGNT